MWITLWITMWITFKRDKEVKKGSYPQKNCEYVGHTRPSRSRLRTKLWITQVWGPKFVNTYVNISGIERLRKT